MCFMSTAPRPQTYPSRTSPPNGSTLQSSASAGTTSRWACTSSAGQVTTHTRNAEHDVGAVRGVVAGQHQRRPADRLEAGGDPGGRLALTGAACPGPSSSCRTGSVSTAGRRPRHTFRILLPHLVPRWRPSMWSAVISSHLSGPVPGSCQLLPELRRSQYFRFPPCRGIVDPGDPLRRHDSDVLIAISLQPYGYTVEVAARSWRPAVAVLVTDSSRPRHVCGGAVLAARPGPRSPAPPRDPGRVAGGGRAGHRHPHRAVERQRQGRPATAGRT